MLALQTPDREVKSTVHQQPRAPSCHSQSLRQLRTWAAVLSLGSKGRRLQRKLMGLGQSSGSCGGAQATMLAQGTPEVEVGW